MILDLLWLHDHSMSDKGVCHALYLGVYSKEPNLPLEGLLGAAASKAEMDQTAEGISVPPQMLSKG